MNRSLDDLIQGSAEPEFNWPTIGSRWLHFFLLILMIFVTNSRWNYFIPFFFTLMIKLLILILIEHIRWYDCPTPNEFLFSISKVHSNFTYDYRYYHMIIVNLTFFSTFSQFTWENFFHFKYTFGLQIIRFFNRNDYLR